MSRASLHSLLVLGLLGLASCASTPFPETTLLESEGTRAFLIGELRERQSRTRLVERATIERGGEAVALTLYADRSVPGELRLAAVSDLGATVFSATWLRGELEVLHASEGFPEAFLERLVPDQAVGLIAPPAEDVELVRLEDGRAALHYELFGSEVLAFVGEERGVLELRRGEDSELLTELELHGEGVAGELRLSASDGSYAGRFTLADWE